MTGTITEYTAVEALKALDGISKKRLYEMMKDGSISYNTEPWGKGTRRIINGAELARVFGKSFKPNVKHETTSKDVSNSIKKPNETIETTIKNSVLETENTFLHEKIKMLESSLTKSEEREKDLSTKLDKAQSTIDKQTHMISDMREKPPQKPVERPKRFLGIFPRKTD